MHVFSKTLLFIPILCGAMISANSSDARYRYTDMKAIYRGVDCKGIMPWSSTTTYTGGYLVVYQGHKWVAKYWTQNDTPRTGDDSPWTDLGVCGS